MTILLSMAEQIQKRIRRNPNHLMPAWRILKTIIRCSICYNYGTVLQELIHHLVLDSGFTTQRVPVNITALRISVFLNVGICFFVQLADGGG